YAGCLGSGLRYLPVPHTGNRARSADEVTMIRGLVDHLLHRCRWRDKHAVVRPLEVRDILIVAPYNAQVSALIEALPALGDRIGTVDRFQGQEAPVVIYSMTSSSPDDAPRGMEFLYNRFRFNVATSRAKALCILVGSPLLFRPECRTPKQMKMANGVCRYRELARNPADDSPRDVADESAITAPLIGVADLQH
ncbi:MAG: RecB family nuclease, partial [Steroidobacteraceae bacterium]|nr:RecB family nuclease [Steroidobacteraceae bacterium]